MMSLGIGLLVGIIVLLFYIKKKVTDTANFVEKKVNQISTVLSHPGEIASTLGSILTKRAVKGVKDILVRKRK